MRRLSHEPLVAVVTPVYEGVEHLQHCVDSVLGQEYENWIHLIVDNASLDGTAEIIEDAAAWDERVVAVLHREHVGMLDNWNRALAAVPADAVYVKQIHADDVLMPDCLRTMVDVAERHPRAALITGLRYSGGLLCPPGAPDELTVVPGRTVGRSALFGGVNYLGTPSLPLLRRERIEGWPALFDPRPFPPRHPDSPPLPHADKQAYLATLEKADLVFVPRVLIDQRLGGESATTWSQRVGGWHPSRIETLLRHGARFASPKELDAAVARAARRWAGSLAWRSARHGALGDADFVLFQSLCLEHVLPRLREAGYAASAALLAPFDALLSRAARDARA
jgi:glycosyltransferase involved in cell wall biosynthesis